MELYTSFKKYNEKFSLFDEILLIDFYDGPTEAICKLRKSKSWYICSLVYYDTETGKRIFTVLDASEDFVLILKPLIQSFANGNMDCFQLIKEKIKIYLIDYSSPLFLLQTQNLNEINYQLVEVSYINLSYFEDIEDVLKQDEISKSRWLSFFYNDQ